MDPAVYKSANAEGNKRDTVTVNKTKCNTWCHRSITRELWQNRVEGVNCSLLGSWQVMSSGFQALQVSLSVPNTVLWTYCIGIMGRSKAGTFGTCKVPQGQKWFPATLNIQIITRVNKETDPSAFSKSCTTFPRQSLYI